MNPINGTADNARNKNNVPPRPPDREVAQPRQPRPEISFWSIELNQDHLSEGALVRATRVIEAALCREAEYDTIGWSSNNSGDNNYPGAHHLGTLHVNVGQLWDKHRMFLAALPAYLEYGRDQEPTTAHAPGA